MAKGRIVQLILDAKNKTSKSFDKVNKDIKKLETNAQRVKAVGNIFALITGGAVAGTLAMNALSDSLVEALGKLDDIGKASRRLGLTTDELQDLRNVAKASGVEISAFDTAFQRFARRAGQARLGTGELVKTFDLLDISLKDNRGNLKSNADLFREFGAKIGAVSDANVQLALTMSGVDTEGVKLIDMFRTSAEEQQKIIEKARELGGVYDESLIKKAEAYKTEIGLIKDAQELLNTQSELGMARMVIGWEKLKLGIIETKNELLRYIGWMGISHDETAKNLIETNKLFDQQIKRLKDKLKVETDPARIAAFKKNLEYAEREKKVVEDQIKEKIQAYEKLSDLESKQNKRVQTITSEQIDEVGKKSESSKKSVDDLKKSVVDLSNVSSFNEKSTDKKSASSSFYKNDLSLVGSESSKESAKNGLNIFSPDTKDDDFDYDKFKKLFGRDKTTGGGVEVNIKPNLDMKEILAQSGASQKEIQAFWDQHPIKVRFDESVTNSVGSANIKRDSISTQALKEGTKQ